MLLLKKATAGRGEKCKEKPGNRQRCRPDAPSVKGNVDESPSTTSQILLFCSMLCNKFKYNELTSIKEFCPVSVRAEKKIVVASVYSTPVTSPV